MATDRQPIWWVLYTLVPLMGGLLVLESGISLSPAGHKFAQISIVVCIYGLVWLWLRANALALLCVAKHTYEKTYVERTYAVEPHRVAQPLRSPLAPRRAYARQAMVRHSKRHPMPQPYRMEINQCSLNSGQQSF
jgi:hypothetical protein